MPVLPSCASRSPLFVSHDNLAKWALGYRGFTVELRRISRPTVSFAFQRRTERKDVRPIKV
jgi:hypothetical protein